jgi:hypothetical protein
MTSLSMLLLIALLCGPSADDGSRFRVCSRESKVGKALKQAQSYAGPPITLICRECVGSVVITKPSVSGVNQVGQPTKI